MFRFCEDLKFDNWRSSEIYYSVCLLTLTCRFWMHLKMWAIISKPTGRLIYPTICTTRTMTEFQKLSYWYRMVGFSKRYVKATFTFRHVWECPTMQYNGIPKHAHIKFDLIIFGYSSSNFHCGKVFSQVLYAHCTQICPKQLTLLVWKS